MHVPDIRIETERLILRPPEPEDFDGWVELMGNEQSARHIGGVQPRPIAWRSFMTAAGVWTMQGFGMFSVIEKSSGRWVGRLGPWHPEGWPGPEVGWGLIVDAWGKGYATEGTVAAMDFVFDELGWDEVVHTIDAENTASQKVARRLGSVFRNVGQMPPPYDKSIDVWGQTKAQWHAHRNRETG